jgi:prepilin-type N-terminal cleavage/methylation domain-containing protein
MKTSKSFTLIELLVVISIISLFASIIFASLQSVRTKARDVKRIADVQQLVSVFNFYRLDNGGDLPDPVALGCSVSPSGTYCLGQTAAPCADLLAVRCSQLNTALSSYISKVPLDPSNDGLSSNAPKPAYMLRLNLIEGGGGPALIWGPENVPTFPKDCAGGIFGVFGLFSFPVCALYLR